MTYILLGLVNGVLISLSRILNGRLSSHRGAFFSSWINHIGGFVFLTVLLFVVQGIEMPFQNVPWHLYLGGIIGGLYVGLNSFVVIRIGVISSTLLVIVGQLFVSVVIDIFLGKVILTINYQTTMMFVGSMFVISGFYCMKDR